MDTLAKLFFIGLSAKGSVIALDGGGAHMCYVISLGLVYGFPRKPIKLPNGSLT